MNLQSQDVLTLTRLGSALWANAEHSRQASMETITAVSLMDLTQDRAIERSASALLALSARAGAASNADALGSPFYRLLPEERLILFALHSARWSYARIARVLEESEETIARIAWSARTALGASVRVYAAAAGSRLSSCPEYDAYSPWTQRFLDDEAQTRERHFLQNHLMACEGCRQTLNRSRNLYYAIERLLPFPCSEVSPGEKDSPAARAQRAAVARSEQETKLLTETLERASFALGRSPMTFTRSLRAFIRKPDVLIAVSFLVGLLVYRLMR